MGPSGARVAGCGEGAHLGLLALAGDAQKVASQGVKLKKPDA